MDEEFAIAFEGAREARRAGRYRKALAEYVRAADTARAKRLTTELIVALCGVGQTERDLGRLKAACSRYREAVSLSRSADDARRLAHALRHLADIERERGRVANAVAPASEAVGIYRSCPDASTLELANALRVWALALDARDQSEQAASIWREAMALYDAEGIDAGVKECEARLSSAEKSGATRGTGSMPD